MSSEPDQTGQWERIAQELRACKESQRKAWGGIEDATLGRYLAGDVSDHELAMVENALEELPELRELTDLVRDVLNDLEPVVFDAPEPVVSTRSRRAPFPDEVRPTRRQRFLAFLRQRSSLWRRRACCSFSDWPCPVRASCRLPRMMDAPPDGRGRLADSRPGCCAKTSLAKSEPAPVGVPIV